MTRNDLHGNAPDDSPIALLPIDVINDVDFPEGDQLLMHARPMANKIAALKKRAKEHGIPVVYVNDNFGRWRSDFNAQVAHCLNAATRGKEVAELLRPDPDDYFVLKPSRPFTKGFLGSAAVKGPASVTSRFRCSTDGQRSLLSAKRLPRQAAQAK
jgi:isochorismate hydrolase